MTELSKLELEAMKHMPKTKMKWRKSKSIKTQKGSAFFMKKLHKEIVQKC